MTFIIILPPVILNSLLNLHDIPLVCFLKHSPCKQNYFNHLDMSVYSKTASDSGKK